MEEDEKALIWIGAFRYYCGRETMAVSSFCESIMRRWQEIPQQAKSVIKRELQEAIKDDERDRRKQMPVFRLGHECDRDNWIKVKDFIYQES